MKNRLQQAGLFAFYGVVTMLALSGIFPLVERLYFILSYLFS